MFKKLRKKIMMKIAEKGMEMQQGLFDSILVMCMTSYKCGRSDCKDFTYDEMKHQEQVKSYIHKTLEPALNKMFEDLKG